MSDTNNNFYSKYYSLLQIYWGAFSWCEDFFYFPVFIFCSCFWKQEPLRSSISTQLRNSLQGLNIASDLLEHAVQLVTNDNLDLGCAVIEQAATDKVWLDEYTRTHIISIYVYVFESYCYCLFTSVLFVLIYHGGKM